MSELRFDGRVVIVTGAGGGLGRAHAHLFAARGARVVVNDLGGSMTGTGNSHGAADRVVDELRAMGATAVASHHSVEDGAAIVKTAVDAFGRLDVVVNNAGILRDVSFHKMTEADWEAVYRVHVLGAFRITHAAWPILREQGYGRVVMTSSAAGIYGNFGQANYAMAKLGLAGFAGTLAVEGRARNVLVNTIAPLAGSRLTETVMPKDLIDALRPEYVSPLVAWLSHEDCTETGGLYEVGGGYFGKLRWERARGKTFRVGRGITPEHVRDAWGEVAGFEQTTHPADVMQSMQPILDNVAAGPSRGGNALIDVDLALGHRFPEARSRYDERDVALYALGIGAGAGKAASDPRQLPLVYELSGDGMRVLPTFAVVPAVNAFLEGVKNGMTAPGLNYGLERVLHGEQRTELFRPLPTRAELTHRAHVKDIFDKGKNAVINVQIDSFEEGIAEPLIRNEVVLVIRGAGGWGGERGPSGEEESLPERAPDAVVEETIPEGQALLYRLSGDWNPLHVDPGFAQAFGFERPILHGLCTLGYAVRQAVEQFSDGDPRFVRRFAARMTKDVYPGETLTTELWRVAPRKILFRARIAARDAVVLSSGVLELFEQLPSAAPPPKEPAPAAAPAASAAPEIAAAPPTTRETFQVIAAYLAKEPALVAKINTTYLFKLKGPDSSWTLDLKGAGSVGEGEVAKPDTTLELSDADWLGMVSGALDPQQLFMSGRLKITGNLMASQKLEFLKKLDPKEGAAIVARLRGAAPTAAAKSPAPAAPPEPPRTSEAPRFFEELAARLGQHPDLSAEVGARLCFHLTEPEGWYTLDFTRAPATLRAERADDATVLTLTEEDLFRLALGAAEPRDLFQRGRLRVDGDVRVAHRLGFLKRLS
jgi:3-hydroxyacyl-CoA dehydrogenase/3a,7a,12a-trihydroxy-5b-cholest-24-enoyl-CoA hydratase